MLSIISDSMSDVNRKPSEDDYNDDNTDFPVINDGIGGEDDLSLEEIQIMELGRVKRELEVRLKEVMEFIPEILPFGQYSKTGLALDRMRYTLTGGNEDNELLEEYLADLKAMSIDVVSQVITNMDFLDPSNPNHTTAINYILKNGSANIIGSGMPATMLDHNADPTVSAQFDNYIVESAFDMVFGDKFFKPENIAKIMYMGQKAFVLTSKDMPQQILKNVSGELISELMDLMVRPIMENTELADDDLIVGIKQLVDKHLATDGERLAFLKSINMSMRDYMQTYSLLQKYSCDSLSTDLFLNPINNAIWWRASRGGNIFVPVQKLFEG